MEREVNGIPEQEYLQSLKLDEAVIETGNSGTSCNLGTIYMSDSHGTCVKWEDGMGTSITHGTRRLTDALQVILTLHSDTQTEIKCYKCGDYTFRPVNGDDKIHVSLVNTCESVS